MAKGPPPPPENLGFLRGFTEAFTLGKKLGRGGSGTVFAAVRRADGAEVAVKTIPKVLDDPNVSERKRAAQIPAIRTEVEVLLALRGTLSVAALEAVYEDDGAVYVVMELCRGGEVLGGSAGPDRHVRYDEAAVAECIRSVLRTVAQCHARGILHRDVKPENFLLASSEPGAPVKAIDFGLAAFFAEGSLPVTAANVEGTPWFLAPESCRAKWYPASDVWAAGVMAAYMLTGKYPFIDRLTPAMPDLARTLKAICFSDLDQSGPEWEELSADARDFVASILLVKDPEKRPTAVQALAHPFLREDGEGSARPNRPLHHSVVQRLQRFSQHGVFKRRVLEHIARDLVKMHFAKDGERSAHGGAVFKERSVRGARAFFEGSQHRLVNRSRSGRWANRAGGSSRGDTGHRSDPDPSTAYHRYLEMHRTGAEGSTHGGVGMVLPAGVYLPVATPYSRRLAVLLDSLGTERVDGKVSGADLESALQKMGYKIDGHEVAELFAAVDVARQGAVPKDELTASLVDWKALQDTFADRWVESVRRVFLELDSDGDGALNAAEIAAAFSGHLDAHEVDDAVHAALVEAAGKGGDEECIDFASLLDLLQNGAVVEDLELFDDRLGGSSGALSRAAARVKQQQQPKDGCCSIM